MKKYQQLLIVSLGLVSFICFLIYKHEYDRLRNVLEVLEVFGSPPPQNSLHAAHPLDVNENPGLVAGSVNELHLGQEGNNHNNAQEHFMADDTFVLKNGHGVRPPDTNDIPLGGDDVNQQKKAGNVIQSPVNSGEVIDNNVGGEGGGDNEVIRKAGAKKMRKVVQRQESIFKERQHKGINDV